MSEVLKLVGSSRKKQASHVHREKVCAVTASDRDDLEQTT